MHSLFQIQIKFKLSLGLNRKIMSHNYVVFDNVVELNKDEDLEQPEPTTVALNDAANKNRASYIGNHRILWIKNKKIIFTLGPHCKKKNTLLKFKIKLFRAIFHVYVFTLNRRRIGNLDLHCSQIQYFNVFIDDFYHNDGIICLFINCLAKSRNYSCRR